MTGFSVGTMSIFIIQDRLVCRNILLCTSDKKQTVGYTIVIHTCVMQDKGESMSGHIPELQMRIVATPNLTRSYLQKLGRQNYLATASSIAIITVSFIWLLFHIGGEDRKSTRLNSSHANIS